MPAHHAGTSTVRSAQVNRVNDEAAPPHRHRIQHPTNHQTNPTCLVVI